MKTFNTIIMFGVDKSGRDTLSPQFSRGPRSKGRSARPGSGLDMEMREHSYVSSLSKSPKFRRGALDQVLRELYEEGKINLDLSILKEVQQEMIEKRYERYMARHKQERDRKADMISSPHAAISGNVFYDSRLDDEVYAFEHKKYRKRLEEEYALDSPRVLQVALRRAFKEGEFDSQEDYISEHIQQAIQSRALELAHKDAQEQMVHASRNAIQSIDI